MATPNPNAKLRVLVCDNGIADEHARYAARDHYAANAIDRVMGRKVEITRVDDLNHAQHLVFSNPRTHYALVVYAGHHINHQAGGMAIQRIENYNPYLPQIIFGHIDRRSLSKGMRRGVRYYAPEIRDLEYELGRIFKEPDEPIKNLTVVKKGGSGFDYDRFNRGIGYLQIAADTLLSIKREVPLKRDQPKKRVIMTVGAGQVGNVVKDFVGNHPAGKKDLGLAIARALELNLQKLSWLFPEGSFNLLRSEDFYFIKNDYLQHLTLMGIAPHYVLSRDQIPLEDSDTQTIAIAEMYQAPRVILIKRTDGVYTFDPNIGNFTANVQRWLERQKDNKLHEIVHVDDLLSGSISREGTDDFGNPDGSRGHLMEDSGLEYFANCRHVNEILVVHIAPEEMYVPLGNNRFFHAITGEELQLGPQGWKGILEQRIRDAFNGIAFSKIVR